jgi:hypothetical protein
MDDVLAKRDSSTERVYSHHRSNDPYRFTMVPSVRGRPVWTQPVARRHQQVLQARSWHRSPELARAQPRCLALARRAEPCGDPSSACEALENVQLRCLSNTNDHAEAPARAYRNQVLRGRNDGTWAPTGPQWAGPLDAPIVPRIESSVIVMVDRQAASCNNKIHIGSIGCRPVLQIGGTILTIILNLSDQRIN